MFATMHNNATDKDGTLISCRHLSNSQNAVRPENPSKLFNQTDEQS
jgi:hypothetical protein